MPADRLPSDRPILVREDDVLERGDFVDALVQTIRKAPIDGYTVALTAPWGEGKTSVINFVVEAVEARGDAQVVRFFPWWFPDSSALAMRFFAELAAELRAGDGEGSEAAARQLMRFANSLDIADEVGIPFVALGARASRGVARALREGSLSTVARKTELEAALRKIDRPILVVIDDIDRLEAEEIREVLRLVRAVGELPRVTYLLGFDVDPVASALSVSGKNGEVALEKIIQARFDLPAPRRSLLDDHLNEALDACLVAHPRLRFSQQAWSGAEWAGIRELVTNLRDVRRLQGALTATLARIGEEVEASDVVVLEILRLQEPAAFRAIAAAAAPLTGISSAGRLRLNDRIDPADQRLVQAIIDAAREPDRLEALVQHLFPASERHFGKGGYAGFEGVWRRDGRVAHIDNLDAYLHRGVPQGAPRRSEVLKAVEALNDQPALDRLLRRPEPELVAIVGRLSDHLETIELSDPAETVGKLLSWAWEHREENDRSFNRGPAATFESIALRLLEQLGHERVDLFYADLPAPDLSARAALARWAGRDRGSGYGLVSEHVARNLEASLVEAVFASNGADLLVEPSLAHLLWRAANFDSDVLAERMQVWLADDVFLTRWLSFQYRMSGGDGYVVDLPAIRVHLTDDVLRDRLDGLDLSGFEAHTRSIITEIAEAIAAAQPEVDGEQS